MLKRIWNVLETVNSFLNRFLVLFVVLLLVGLWVFSPRYYLSFGPIPTLHNFLQTWNGMETADAEAFCKQMGADEPVCVKFSAGRTSYLQVEDCMIFHINYLEVEEPPNQLCFSEKDTDDLHTVFMRLPRVDWGDGNFAQKRAELLKEWARGIDDAGCERGTEELTSVRCALHAAAMAELTPAN